MLLHLFQKPALVALAAVAAATAPAVHEARDVMRAVDETRPWLSLQGSVQMRVQQGPGQQGPGLQSPGAKPARPTDPTKQTETDDDEAATPLFAWRSVWSRSTSFDQVSNNAANAPKLPQRPGASGPSSGGPSGGGGSGGGPITNWTPYMQIPSAPRPISIYMP